MLLKIYPQNIDERLINKVVETLTCGGKIIYPTDTIYGLGCDIHNKKAVEQIARLKGKDPEKANFSFICSDLSHLSDYTKPINNSIFKLIKRHLPGPFTFILEASNNVPAAMVSRRKTVGIRIPDNLITLEIVRRLGHPVVSTTVPDEDEISGYTTDPEVLYEKFKKLVDIVIDGGAGGNMPSTVVDCTSGEPLIIRQGKGLVDW